MLSSGVGDVTKDPVSDSGLSGGTSVTRGCSIGREGEGAGWRGWGGGTGMRGGGIGSGWGESGAKSADG